MPLLVARVFLGAALFWLVASQSGGWNVALPVLSSPAMLLPGVAFSLVGAWLEALRLTTLLRSQGMSISIAQGFRLVTAAFALNFCIPGGASGDLSKLFYLRAARTDKGWELATAVFVDRLVGLFSMLLLIAILGALSWSFVLSLPIFMALFWIAATVMAGILVFAGLCLSTVPSLRSFLRKLVSVLPLRRYLTRIADALFRFGDHRAALARSSVYSFIGNVAGAAVFTVLGWELFAQAVFPVPAFISMLGMFANTITITPGGLGVGEAAFDRLFAEAGLRGGAAMMIIWRAGMLPLTLLGIAFFLSGLALSSRGAHDGTDKNEREGSSAL
jgi:uncharacterized protein (TIRG00374 family)